MMDKNNPDKIVFACILSLLDDQSSLITRNSQILGLNALLDSMQLVELSILLEDKALELGFTFDWTSESAMSRSRSMYRTAGTLSDEFYRQMQAEKV